MAAPIGNPISSAPADGSPVVNPVTGHATTHMKQWMRAIKRVLSPGISITSVPLAKLTVGGTAGSIQVVNGIVTQYTAPT